MVRILVEGRPLYAQGKWRVMSARFTNADQAEKWMIKNGAKYAIRLGGAWEFRVSIWTLDAVTENYVVK